MNDIDIRETQEVERIIFANAQNGQVTVGHCLDKFAHKGNSIRIQDGDEFVVICGLEHANNLIKAIEKAKELGWLQ